MRKFILAFIFLIGVGIGYACAANKAKTELEDNNRIVESYHSIDTELSEIRMIRVAQMNSDEQ
jgi:hypothetical protein